MRRLMALGAFFVVGAGLAGCGSGVPGDSVAVVDGNPITLSAFNHWMYVAAKGQSAGGSSQPIIVPTDPPQFNGCISQVRRQIPSLAKASSKQLRSDCKQLFSSLSSQVMDFLIKGYWYQAEAAKQHITVTDAQVQKAYQQAKQAQFPTATQFQSFLKQTGYTINDLMFRVRVNQVYTKLISKHPTTITNAQITSYYQSHTSQFGSAEKRDMRIVLTKTAAQASAAKAALSSGQSWNAVAKRYSTDTSTKNKGGLLTGVTQGSEDAALDKAAFAAPKNKVEGPVHGQFGYYVFEIVKVTPGTQKPLSQVSGEIRQLLQSEAQTAAANTITKQAEKDFKSKTQCRSEYAMADCSGFKAPKTTTTGTGTAGTSTG